MKRCKTEEDEIAGLQDLTGYPEIQPFKMRLLFFQACCDLRSIWCAGAGYY